MSECVPRHTEDDQRARQSAVRASLLDNLPAAVLIVPFTTKEPRMRALHFAVSAFVVIGSGLLLVSVTGCDGDKKATPAAASSQPATGAAPTAAAKKSCDLLTREEAAAAAGNPVRAGKRVGIVCIWEPEDLDDNRHVQVSVGYVAFPPGANSKQLCAAGLAGIPNSKPFAGIGDEAYWEFQQGGLSSNGSLHVCVKQGTVDTAAIGGRSEAALQQIAVSLAKTVLARL